MSLILYKNYTSNIKALDTDLYTQMRLCSFDLKCTQFTFDFVSAKDEETYQFTPGEQGPFALFKLPNKSNYVLKLLYPKENYNKEKKNLQTKYIYDYLLFLLILSIISISFSWYALRPLRHALILSDEFIKDILHDFNTPLSSLRLNSSLLQNELPHNKKLGRIEQAVETILNLQNNLRSYIDESPLHNEELDLKDLIKKRSVYFSENYPDISFHAKLDALCISTNTDAMTRILDNILSNAAKYNKKDGSVEIRLDADKAQLIIADTGRGIKNPKKVFDRFYKEHDRGLGIGLHIVKKLADAMHIPIQVDSKLEVGSTFTLNLKELISS